MPRFVPLLVGVQRFLSLYPLPGPNIQKSTRNGKGIFSLKQIVPPANWKPQAHDYQQKLEHLMVKNPIEQNVQGRGGFYESKNIVQPKLSLKAYRKYAEKESSKVASTTTA